MTLKFTTFISRSVAALALSCAMAVALTGSEARAVTLLTVDVTNPGAVVFTGTGAAAEIDITVSAFSGFSLLDMFSTNVDFLLAATSSTLAAGTAVVQVADSGSDAGTFMNFYSAGGFDFTFTTSVAAFTGALVVDLSAFAALLPTAGATGRIVTGDGGATLAFGAEFGSWAVVSPSNVPLPAALPLLLAGIAGLGALRLRRRA
jgi:hypothetical protein